MAENASRCDVCGGPVESYKGNGRPRKRCASCAADKGALMAHWRAQHPDYQAAYNASRRMSLPDKNRRTRRLPAYLR